MPETGYADATAAVAARPRLGHAERAGRPLVGAVAGRAGRRRCSPRTTAAGAVFGAGEHYHYSNLGFALLGEAVARVRRRPGADLVQARVTGPLGDDADVVPPARRRTPADCSVHHLRGTLTEEPPHDTGAMAPAGQLWSTIEDLARFAAFLADGHPDVLSPRDADRDAAGGAARHRLRARGADRSPSRTGVLVGHTGSMPGFQATLFADPLNRVGVVALTNATTGFSGTELALALLGRAHARRRRRPGCRPSGCRPGPRSCSGYWHWGNSAYEVRWHNEPARGRDLARGCGRRAVRAASRDASSAWRATTTARPSTSYAATTGPSTISSAPPSCYTRQPYPDGP